MNFLILFFSFAVLCSTCCLPFDFRGVFFVLDAIPCLFLPWSVARVEETVMKKLTGGQGFLFHSKLWWGNKLLQWFLLFLTFWSWSMFLMFFFSFPGTFFGMFLSGKHSLYLFLGVWRYKAAFQTPFKRNVFHVSPRKWTQTTAEAVKRHHNPHSSLIFTLFSATSTKSAPWFSGGFSDLRLHPLGSNSHPKDWYGDWSQRSQGHRRVWSVWPWLFRRQREAWWWGDGSLWGKK